MNPSERSTGVRGPHDPATRRQSFPALPPRLARGDRLGDYDLVAPIHEGSHSSVYKARSRFDRRDVAVKVLASQLSLEPVPVVRFRAEVAFAERVRHPSILPIYGCGHERGYDFYAMRLMSGRTLADWILDRRPGRDLRYYVDIAERFASVASAVAAIHDDGLIHRDIKPSNILIGADGRFSISDFGSALDSIDRDPRLESYVGGTVLYMSPEQLRSGADPYDPKGDIYALGATLYELCSGAPLFSAADDEAELARWKVTRRPVELKQVNPYVPLSLEAIVRQAIDPDPAARHATAEDLADHLRRFARRRGAHRNS